MDNLHAEQVRTHLRDWTGRTVYIHLEVNPGAYWRNGSGVLMAAHVHGEGSYRVYLELDSGVGLIQVDGLTHMELTPEHLIVIGFDDSERLARTLEMALTPFPMNEGEQV